MDPYVLKYTFYKSPIDVVSQLLTLPAVNGQLTTPKCQKLLKQALLGQCSNFSKQKSALSHSNVASTYH